MRRNTPLQFIFVAIALTMMNMLCCCRRQHSKEPLQIADRIIADNPDSANTILEGIDPGSLSDEADKALYQLLYPQAQFKLYKKTQSTPIDFSIDYFQKKKDHAHLLRAFYYRAAIRRDNGYDLKECLKDYKAAEALIPQVNDTMMAYRIYDDLCSINYELWNPTAELRYARKNCLIALERKDWENYVTALNNIALAFMQEEKDDSAEHYMKKALSACRHDVSDSIKSTTYQNMAAFQIDSKKDYAKAMTYIREGQRYLNSDAALFTLSEIYLRTGANNKAESILHQLVHSKDTFAIINAHDMLSRIDTARNDYHDAYRHKAYSDSILLAFMNGKQEDELNEIQQRYDFQLQESRHQQDVKDIVIAALVTISTTFAVLLYISRVSILRKKRIQRLQDEIISLNDDIRNIGLNNTSLDTKITSLSNLIKEKKDIIHQLQHDIGSTNQQLKQSQTYFNDLKNGMLWFFYIMNDEPQLDLRKKQCMDIIQCYRLIDGQFINAIESTPAISCKETVFCIMVRLSKSKEQIINIMGYSSDAYRQMKHRIADKLKRNESLNAFRNTIERT